MPDWDRAPVVGQLDLCEIDTADRTFRFLIGTDGILTDVNGNQWLGSALTSVSGLELAIGGTAPGGSVKLTFFQDPALPDVIAQLRALGLPYIAGREIRFYTQPLHKMSDLAAPTTPPELWLTRTMRTLTFAANRARDRSITVGFEAWSEERDSARRIVMNPEGHATLLGSANPSLEFAPTSDFQEERLFG